MNLDKLTKNVISIAKEAGLYLKSEIVKLKANDIEIKGEHDYVSYVDKKSEAFIIAELQKIFPEAGIIAEESQNITDAKRFHWIIDPLDGTTNYIHKMAPYSVSIALTDGNTEIMGVIYEISQDECFYANVDSKAYLNNEKIAVSNIEKLCNSFIATGFPSKDYSRIEEYIDFMKSLMFSTQGIRRLGSAAVDLAYVACGRFDVFYEYHLNAWDVAAGSLIVKKAGGKVTDFCGGTNYLFGKEIVASNRFIHQEFLNQLKKYFYEKNRVNTG